LTIKIKDTIKEKGWREILHYYEKENKEIKNLILESKEIKKITGKEPRILCKFDSREDFPQVLAKEGLFILPIKNRFYKILEGDGFQSLDNLPKEDVTVFTSKIGFKLKTSEYGKSESRFLDIAINTGLIEKFTGISPLYLSIRGRKYSPKEGFSFKFGKEIITVRGVQVEVDAGFEGEDAIVLIEAKGARLNSFNIRQLYYPYRFWCTESEKEIINIFFWYEEETDTYHFCQYNFEVEEDYHSIYLEKYRIYKIKQHEVEEVKELSDRMIPQADNLQKVIRLVREVSDGHNNAKRIAERLNFTTRQSSYYRQAAEILQLVTLTTNKIYNLTENGLRLIRANEKEITEILTEQITSIPIVEKILRKTFQQPGNELNIEDIVTLIINQTGLSEATARRRTRTLCKWFKWIEVKVGGIEVKDKSIILNDSERITLDRFFKSL